MVKTLTRHGNSLALEVDKPVLDLLDIGADTPLCISTDGRALVVEPDGEHGSRVRAAIEKANHNGPIDAGMLECWDAGMLGRWN